MPRARRAFPFFPLFRRLFFRIGVLFGVVFLLGASKPLDEIQLTIGTGSQGTMQLRGSFEVKASARTVWEVLTDYGRLTDIVSSIETSRVLSRRGDLVMLDQEALGRVLLFSRRLRVRLEIHEQPMQSITFIDHLRTDFDLYRGDWRIEPTPAGVRVCHAVTARPSFAVPSVILKEVFQATAHDLLREIRREIVRRAGVSEARSIQR